MEPVDEPDGSGEGVGRNDHFRLEVNVSCIQTMEHQRNAGSTFFRSEEYGPDPLIGLIKDKIVNLLSPLSPEMLSNPAQHVLGWRECMQTTVDHLK